MRMLNFFRKFFPGAPVQAGSKPLKVIVGLGNPGVQYQHTPHNLGFEVIDRLAATAEIVCGVKQCRSLTGVVQLAGFEVLLAKPQTYMNRSGPSVKGLLERYALTAGDLIVVCDDLALPWGKIRVRAKGGSGGHKGLQSIIDTLATNEFVRMRLGIAPEAEVVDVVEYVLCPIPREKAAAAREMIDSGAEAAKTICQSGVQAAMNGYN
jgi:PTH1 family peptidyl-tRNA hydrolase